MNLSKQQIQNIINEELKILLIESSGLTSRSFSPTGGGISTGGFNFSSASDEPRAGDFIPDPYDSAAEWDEDADYYEVDPSVEAGDWSDLIYSDEAIPSYDPTQPEPLIKTPRYLEAIPPADPAEKPGSSWADILWGTGPAEELPAEVITPEEEIVVPPEYTPEYWATVQSQRRRQHPLGRRGAGRLQESRKRFRIKVINI
tara:strand:- start:1512 stop:2114 length:603 start_codon:yes stop_codon:yes gene_type:complete